LVAEQVALAYKVPSGVTLKLIFSDMFRGFNMLLLISAPQSENVVTLANREKE
jgi:hypothetical protein